MTYQCMSIMSPVAQEIEDPSSQLILINKNSPSSSLSTSTTSMEEMCTLSMDSQDENLSMFDAGTESTITLVKCLERTSPSYSFVAQRCDKSAILRLSNELLKAKRSNWQVVDALGKAYEDIRDLRLREQRLNALLSSSAKIGSNGFIDNSLESKIIELQLSLRKEEVIKTRKDLRDLITERDELKEKLEKTQSDMRFTTFAGERLERELDLSQSFIQDLTTNIKEKEDRINMAQEKLRCLDKEMKIRDNEVEKLREEKSTLREAVIRSEQEIERLSEKIRNIEHFKCERIVPAPTRDPSNEYGDSENHPMAEKMTLVKEMEYLEAKRNEDKRIMDDLKLQIQGWESAVNSMNEYVKETNERQLKAKQEVSDYVKRLEGELQEVKNALRLKNETATFTHCQQEQHSKDGRRKDSKGIDRRDKEQQCLGVMGMNEFQDNELDGCHSYSIATVEDGEVRMARLVSTEEYVTIHLSSSDNSNSNDCKQWNKKSRKMSSSRSRRKLPEVAKKTSAMKCQSTMINNDQVNDSTRSQSDDSTSITSSEIQTSCSRDLPSMRRVAPIGLGRRLSSAPCEKDTEVQRAANSVVMSAARELPKVTSLYHKAPVPLANHRQDSGLGESIINSPLFSDRKFSIRKSIQLKFGKKKSNSGIQELDVNDLGNTRKGLFQRRISLLRGQKRRNSIGATSSASDSFRTVTPLSSDKDGRRLSYEDSDYDDREGRRSNNRTSTLSAENRKTNQGDTPKQTKRFSVQRRKACLLLTFRYLNPIELCGVARVSREWHEISEHPSLWKHVILEEIPLNNIVLQAISRRCSCTQYLKLRGLKRIKTTEPFVDQDKSCYLERGLEYLLRAAGSSLLRLHIEDCGVFITDRCFTLASCYSRELQEMVYISDSFPACPEALWALWACRRIVTLRVTPMFPCLRCIRLNLSGSFSPSSDHPTRFNDKSLETIANCWPNLRHLSIGGSSLSTTGLIHIAKRCLRLQELELDRMITINEETIHALCLCGLKGLEAISFTFTPVSEGAIKVLLGACPRLERIEVHIGISDYFVDVEDDNNKRKYKRIVRKLMALRRENPELGRVFRIKADYG